MATKLRLIAVALSATLIGACAVQPGNILETGLSLDSQGKITGITTGARQRFISSHEPGVLSNPGQVDPLRVVCVEPSPDVAVAIANSFGTGLSVLRQGSSAVSGSTVEGVAQLAERTVAIQALLKQGYQACLDYANGAITRTTYSLRTAKLDDLLVTLVLGEVAGGAFGRGGATIGTASNAQATAALAGLAATGEALESAREGLANTQQRVTDKQAELTAEKAKLETVPPPQGVEEETIRANITTLEAELAIETALHEDLRKNLSSASRAFAQSAAEVRTVAGVGGLENKPDAQVAQVISEMQARFLEKDTDHAFVSACMTEMADARRPENLNSRTQDDVKRALDDLVTQSVGKLNDKIRKGVDTGPLDYFAPFSALVKYRPSTTWLLEFCSKNLHTFLQKSQQNGHELRQQELELERERIKASAAKAKQPATAGGS